MRKEKVKLIEPSLELKAEFQSMAAEYVTAGENPCADMYEEAIKDFNRFVGRLRDHAKGLNLPEGWVRSSAFWLVEDNNHILGCSRLRHHLVGRFLKYEGGHIGYEIRPSERRKGYGTLILALTLQEAYKIGLERVLVTCHTDNIASARIIERNGGKFAGIIIPKPTGKPLRRYWVDLKSSKFTK